MQRRGGTYAIFFRKPINPKTNLIKNPMKTKINPQNLIK